MQATCRVTRGDDLLPCDSFGYVARFYTCHAYKYVSISRMFYVLSLMAIIPLNLSGNVRGIHNKHRSKYPANP